MPHCDTLKKAINSLGVDKFQDLNIEVNYYPKDDYVDPSNSTKKKIVRASVDSRFETVEELNMIDPGPILKTTISNTKGESSSPSPSNMLIHEDTFVFCNFNKNDKLEPFSFHVWMNILKRVPNSIIWMLSPSRAKGLKQIKKNICHKFK